MSILVVSRQAFTRFLCGKRLQYYCSIVKETTANVDEFHTQTFQESVHFRRDEANRSLLVQVQSSSSHTELYHHCSAIGNVKNMLHYSTGIEPMNFIIVEFSTAEEVRNAFKACAYLEDAHAVPVQSQFLWFRAVARNSHKTKTKMAKSPKLMIENGCRTMKDTDIEHMLRNSNSISEQIERLYEVTKLNDVGSRLRFLAAKQIEMAVAGMFPAAVALPFGSSVNGYGKMGCDLDLVLQLNNHRLPGSGAEERRLVYHSKATIGSERSTSQKHMEAIGDILQLFLPGCAQVRRILQARVPIIKYYQQLTDIECDLSMSNLSGVHMSDLLFVMGSIDGRVRPLVFTVRKWAAETGLTNTSPGRWITNFSLTLLVLAFLQSKQCRILPAMNRLVQLARDEDRITTEDGLNCTFLRNHRTYLATNRTQTNTDNLEQLLRKFFEHYSSFDFANKAVSLNEGAPITKPDHSPMYIVNPLERGLNVSKNVSVEELEKFRAEIRNAMWLLECDETRKHQWGLLQLFTWKKKKTATSSKATKLVDVSTLFQDEFKNDDVKQQVHAIRKATKQQIQKFHTNYHVECSQKSNR